MLDFSDIDKKFKRDAKDIDWLMFFLYRVFLAEIFLVMLMGGLFYKFLIPNLVYLASLAFLALRRRRENSKTLAHMYIFAIVVAILFLLMQYSISRTIVEAPY